MSHIEMNSVNVTFGNKTVIRDFNFSWKSNEPALVTGPSGAGKTTLLRLTAGLIVPSSGEVIRPDTMKVGMVFQNPRLLPWKRAWQNIAIPLWNIGFTHQKAEKLSRELLKAFDLESAAEAWPSELSGGMAQRISIARALAVEPNLLLLDEPLNGLDLAAKQNVIRILTKYIADKKPICISVSHYPDELRELAKVHLHFSGQGKIIEQVTAYA